jgi:putative phosphoribosyl transferase
VSGTVFADRADAGRRLGAELAASRRVPPDALVAGIPRGGVVVAAEVARVTGCPLRAVLARKVGAPGHRELAIGAVGPDGAALVDQELATRIGVAGDWLTHAVDEQRAAVTERAARFPGVVTAREVAGRAVVVVDDGVATGSTAAAVGAWLEHVGASRRVLALPVGPPATLERLAGLYDELFVLQRPSSFVAVGEWYRDFGQTTDDEVVRLLRELAG